MEYQEQRETVAGPLCSFTEVSTIGELVDEPGAHDRQSFLILKFVPIVIITVSDDSIDL